MRTGVLIALLSALLTIGPVPARAEPPEPEVTSVTLAAPSVVAGSTTTLAGRLTDAVGQPLVGRTVTIRRRIDGTWQLLGERVTGADGGYALATVLRRDADDNVYHARFDGDPAYAAAVAGPTTVPLVRRHTSLTISGPATVRDESSATLTLTHRTRAGEPVPGWVRVETWRDGRWRFHRSVLLGGLGNGRLTVTPRVDTRWRGVAKPQDWVYGDTSGVHALDNLPGMPPVRLPSGAPRPSIILPPQPRAVGKGPYPVVSRIPDSVWRDMVGRSWHSGCPVGRAGLRLVRINYWAFDGYRRRGELVVAAGVTGKFVRAFSALHEQRLPLRSMYRVDRFGWSSVLQGANDYRSMAADNTSAFNCRTVVNNPDVRSPHAWGRSVDMNPWENPYRSRTGPVPNGWWLSRSHPQVAWRSRSHPVVQVMRAAGFGWTYAVDDSQHFDGRAAEGGWGFVAE